VYAKKYINLHLQFRKNKNCQEKKTAHKYMVSSLPAKNHLSSTPLTPLFSGFQNQFIFDPFLLITLLILVLFLQIVLIVEFMRPNS